MMQKEYIGRNTITKLKKILHKHNPKKIFLVIGKSSYEKSGAKGVIERILKDYKVIHFSDLKANPEISSIEKGFKVFKENNCDFVIAVGGGSAMDTAKLINIFAANEGNPIEYIEKKKNIGKKGKTFVAVPTTSGSGSEATKFAVVNIGKTKKSFESDFIIPDYAIVDPQLTMSLPKYITASTGMDALSQAIESYWSINSTRKSKKFSVKAIKLILKNLPDSVNSPSKKSREAMAMAANLAGKAINITKTTACHSISYPMTSYFNVAHGHAVALTLAEMLIYNSQVTEKDILDKRGVSYVKKTVNEIAKLLGARNTKDACNKINNLMNEIGLSTRLRDLEIKRNKSIEIIIKNGFNPDRVKNNPRRLTEKALRKILNDIR